MRLIKVIYLWLLPILNVILIAVALFPEYVYGDIDVDKRMLRILAGMLTIMCLFLYIIVRKYVNLMETPLSFEDWYDSYGELIAIKHAESGRDRELGYDADRAYEDEYEYYLTFFPEKNRYD